jgi:hypothetical protein
MGDSRKCSVHLKDQDLRVTLIVLFTSQSFWRDVPRKQSKRTSVAYPVIVDLFPCNHNTYATRKQFQEKPSMYDHLRVEFLTV